MEKSAILVNYDPVFPGKKKGIFGSFKHLFLIENLIGFFFSFLKLWKLCVFVLMKILENIRLGGGGCPIRPQRFMITWKNFQKCWF